MQCLHYIIYPIYIYGNLYSDYGFWFVKYEIINYIQYHLEVIYCSTARGNIGNRYSLHIYITRKVTKDQIGCVC